MNFTVLGAGSWGITLSILLSEQKHKVSLWEFDKNACQELVENRESKDKLPGVIIPKEISIYNDIDKAVQKADAYLFAIPSQFVRSAIKKVDYIDFSNSIVVNVAKGIENNSLKRMSEVFEEENNTINPSNYVIISGPSHAEEVSRHIPTTVVAASHNFGKAETVQNIFSTHFFRVYSNNDVIGVELGGSLKNVIAVAAGVLDGLGYGDNAKGALLTRGMAEITRLGIAMGAQRETFFGLSGMGDLITTCISKFSRNRNVGEQIGRGKKLNTVLSEMKMVAEGVATSKSVFQLAAKYNVDMPIINAVHDVLFNDKNPKEAVYSLMDRSLKQEKL